MEATDDRARPSDLGATRAVRPLRTPQIRWAHNPSDTSRVDLLWFLAIPAVMTALVLAINLTLALTGP